MGWEDAILPSLKNAMEEFPSYGTEAVACPFFFGKDRKQRKHLSPNHWEMGLAHDILASAQSGFESDWWEACDAYAHCLDLHLRQIGLWTSEQFTGAPHGGFYLASLVAARMAVITAANRGLPLAPTLASDLDEYTKRTIQYLVNTATPSGEIICCGERMRKGPSAPQQSAFYRELRGMPHPKEEARKIDRQAAKSDDFYWLSLRGLRQLIEARDPIKLMARQVDMLSLPFTSQPVTLLRYKDGHAAYYDAGGGDGTCEWVDVRGGRVSWGLRGSARPRPAAGVLFEVKTQKRGESTMPTPKAPTTFAELDAAAALPYYRAVKAIAGADTALVESWGRKLYGSKFGHGYMHSTDHYAALLVVLDREPTYREVYDSYHLAGSKNIDAARVKSGGEQRPEGWDQMSAETKRYHVLVHRYRVVKGSKIFDGQADPDPAGTQRQLDEWNGTTTGAKPEPDPVDPPVTPPPPAKPLPTPVVIKHVTLTLTIDGVERRFNLTEIV
jgi:hypothetical protein